MIESIDREHDEARRRLPPQSRRAKQEKRRKFQKDIIVFSNDRSLTVAALIGGASIRKPVLDRSKPQKRSLPPSWICRESVADVMRLKSGAVTLLTTAPVHPAVLHAALRLFNRFSASPMSSSVNRSCRRSV